MKKYIRKKLQCSIPKELKARLQPYQPINNLKPVDLAILVKKILGSILEEAGVNPTKYLKNRISLQVKPTSSWKTKSYLVKPNNFYTSLLLKMNIYAPEVLFTLSPLRWNSTVYYGRWDSAAQTSTASKELVDFQKMNLKFKLY